jgi:methylated-DNA-[protein]-cysteine S-methyltransferase
MAKDTTYTIFRTNWGYFGLMGTPEALTRTFLPVSSRNKAKQMLLAYRPQARYDSGLFIALQEKIRAYFRGECADFVSVPVDLGDFSAFAGKVLSACGTIGYGQTASYAQLAQLAHAPKAVRAAGSVMAKNPIPLIIPCHRIIRSDGSIGNFSASGGQNLKKKLHDLDAGITPGSAE